MALHGLKPFTGFRQGLIIALSLGCVYIYTYRKTDPGDDRAECAESGLLPGANRRHISLADLLRVITSNDAPRPP